MPLLRSLPDTVTGNGLRRKEDIPGHSGETGQTAMKIIRDLQNLLYSLLDVLAYRLTFR
jgi:hypothetical protein